MKKLLITVLPVVLSLLFVVPASAASHVASDVLRCTAAGEKKGLCKANYLKPIGKATTKGVVTRNSYTPSTTTLNFNVNKKTKIAVVVEVRIDCAPSYGATAKPVSFRKNLVAKRGRNVVTVKGRRIACPAGHTLKGRPSVQYWGIVGTAHVFHGLYL